MTLWLYIPEFFITKDMRISTHTTNAFYFSICIVFLFFKIPICTLCFFVYILQAITIVDCNIYILCVLRQQGRFVIW